MKNKIIEFRNSVFHILYRVLLKPIFFKNDPETVHDKMVHLGSVMGKYILTQGVLSAFFDYSNNKLEQNVLNMHFKNPIGLAAGFDKNAELLGVLGHVGFGFVEIGSITGYPCAGNPKPRLWRLKESRSLVVWYGLKNDGCDVIAKKLSKKKYDVLFGTSVAMTNCAENLDTEKAVADYVKAFKAFVSIGEYFTINISCPNAQGGQPFIDPQKLEKLLTAIDPIETKKPVFIKLSPDLSNEQIDQILDVVKKHRVHGIICTNLTKKRDNVKILDKNIPEKGGISGKVVEDLSNKLISYIYKRDGGRFIIIGCGGVFSAEDAYKKIRQGATLVQLVTGMIFEGPQLISTINCGLVKLLEKDGFNSISEAIGADYK